MESFLDLNLENISNEHICCAISDKKCTESYEAKKEWLRGEFKTGYVFRRLNARAKVFIEYGPSELAWVPVEAPNYFLINCFWVSGQYKGKGYGKALLQSAMDHARNNGKNGLATVAGKKKFHFMSDTKWLIQQGFEVCDSLEMGFVLLVKKINPCAENPKFKTKLDYQSIQTNGLVAIYSNRCPFAEFHVKTSLVKTAAKRHLPLTVIKLETMEQAQCAPSPATIFSLFYKGKFVTTDISACMDNRFDRVLSDFLKY